MKMKNSKLFAFILAIHAQSDTILLKNKSQECGKQFPVDINGFNNCMNKIDFVSPVEPSEDEVTIEEIDIPKPVLPITPVIPNITLPDIKIRTKQRVEIDKWDDKIVTAPVKNKTEQSVKPAVARVREKIPKVIPEKLESLPVIKKSNVTSLSLLNDTKTVVEIDDPNEIIYGSPEAKSALSFKRRALKKRGLRMNKDICSSIKRMWNQYTYRCMRTCKKPKKYKFNRRKYRCFKKSQK